MPRVLGPLSNLSPVSTCTWPSHALVLGPGSSGGAADVTWPPSPFQVEYLLKKLLGSMSLEIGLGELEELLAQEAQAVQTSGGLSVWQFLELFNSGRCLRGVGRDSLSMAIQEVYQELIQDVLKQVSLRGSFGEGDGDLRTTRREDDRDLEDHQEAVMET